MKYLAVIEKAADGSFSAYFPDVPGCVACGDTADEARKEIAEALLLHLKSLRRHGEPIPEPSASVVPIEAA
jgi:predicted RNase H-like HicB family nuclease